MKLTPAEELEKLIGNRMKFMTPQSRVKAFRQIQANAIRWAADFCNSPNSLRLHDQANQLDPMPSGKQACGDCDPCIGGRPDQCAISPEESGTVDGTLKTFKTIVEHPDFGKGASEP